MKRNFKPSTQLSFKEEIGNSVSHGIAAILMLCLLPFTAVFAYLHYDMTASIGMSIFVISLFLMFLSSTIYHSMSYGSEHKYVMRIIDHSMIYVAIAGSYTPIALSLVGGWLGITIIIIQWGITVFGILYKIFAPTINEKFSLFLYLFMGWLAILVIPAILKQTTPLFLFLIFLGGLSYSIGAAFYAKKKPYYHMIWHLFIILASLSHYFAIVYFMI